MIRAGNINDCFWIYSLICEMENYKLSYSIFKNIYEKMINNDSYAVLVDIENNKIVGEITLRFELQLHHCSKIAEIMECTVKKEYRCRGIGSLLFDRACSLAKSKECSQIEVSSNCIRTRAHNFYEKLGMKNTHYKFCKPL